MHRIAAYQYLHVIFFSPLGYSNVEEHVNLSLMTRVSLVHLISMLDLYEYKDLAH